MPRVSILIPLYKAEKYIAQTIESVLKQNFTDYEIIVVDDCGGDNSLEIAKTYQRKDGRIKIFRNDKNYGIAYTRNRGLRECRGEYIALLDNDDLMVGERLNRQVDFLDANPMIGAVGGGTEWINEKNEIIHEMIKIETEPLEIKMYLHFRNIFNNSEMTFRKCIVDDNDIRYRDGYYGMEDFRFWIEFSKISKISNIKDLVLQKRCLLDNETTKIKQLYLKERKEKFLELQIYSLEKSGFIISNQDKEIIRKYMGEEEGICNRYNDIIYCMTKLFDNLLNQAKQMQLDCYANMKNWFHNLIIWHADSIYQRNNVDNLTERENNDTIFEIYLNELLKEKKNLEKHYEEQKKCIEEIQRVWEGGIVEVPPNVMNN